MDVFAPIEALADVVTYQWLHIAAESYLGKAVHFFIYDTIKIGLLLVVINYIMAITRTYFPSERVRAILTAREWYGFDYLLAALLGVVTPFCSCSSIPLFMGFLSAGIPLGVTFAFLISSPLVNEASLYLFPAIFGLKTTLLYNLLGIGVGVLGGYVIEKLKMERYVQPEFLKLRAQGGVSESEERPQVSPTLIKHWSEEAWQITKKVFPYVVLGVGLGALIHGYVPQGLVERYLSANGWWGVPIAAFMGVPFYANSISVVPVIEALFQKGVALGTGLAFMTAAVTLSIPEAMMLRTVMKTRLLILFFGITTVGIMLVGFVLNALA